MLRETERDEQIAAARRIPRNSAIQVADAPPAYEPARAAAVPVNNVPAASQTAALQNTVNSRLPPQPQTVSAPADNNARTTAAISNDGAMPQPELECEAQRDDGGHDGEQAVCGHPRSAMVRATAGDWRNGP